MGRDTLTLKQKTLAEHYTAQGTPTFSNGTQSALQAYNTTDKPTAGAIATEVLKKPQIQSYIQTLLDAEGLGMVVRAQVVAEIIRGEQPATTVTTKTYDADGTLVSSNEQATNRPITATARLKAIDLLNRMDGTYVRAGVEGDVARKELSDLRKRVVKDIGGKAKKGKAKP